MKLRHRLSVVAGLVVGSVLTPGVALGHGIGGRGDLPVPLEFFLVGAALALVVSFVGLTVLWPEPRLQTGPLDRPLAARWLGPVASLLAVVGVAGLGLVVGAGIFGDLRGRSNVAPVLVWVYFWLVIPFLSALVGDLWQYINPWRSIERIGRLGRIERPELVEKLGVWPAAVGFVAFTWLELVWVDPARPRLVAGTALIYTLYLAYSMDWAGRETALEVGDAFTSYNALIGAIAPVGHDLDRGLVWRGWLRALPAVRERPGLTVFVVAMIGTVSYDGLSNTVWWRDVVGQATTSQWFGTLALLSTIAVISAGYWLASWVAARLAPGGGLSATGVARSFAHTLVPIAFAYAFAHYFTLVIFEGQILFSTISDPFGLGWDLFGTAGRPVNFWLSPNSVWYIQVAAIVSGHTAAVVLAHDRALALFPREHAAKSQYAMLGLMVGLTVFGLTLLGTG